MEAVAVYAEGVNIHPKQKVGVVFGGRLTQTKCQSRRKKEGKAHSCV